MSDWLLTRWLIDLMAVFSRESLYGQYSKYNSSRMRMRRMQYLHFRFRHVFTNLASPLSTLYSKFGNFNIKIDQNSENQENIMAMDSRYDYNYCFPEGVPLSFRNPTREDQLVELCKRKRKSFQFVIATMFRKVNRVRESTKETLTTYHCCYCRRSWVNFEDLRGSQDWLSMPEITTLLSTKPGWRQRSPL